MHIGEGRILDEETLARFLTTSKHTSPCCFPHIPTAYDPQGLKLTPPAHIYSKTRPLQKEQLQIPDLFKLEVKGWFSDTFYMVHHRIPKRIFLIKVLYWEGISHIVKSNPFRLLRGS